MNRIEMIDKGIRVFIHSDKNENKDNSFINEKRKEVMMHIYCPNRRLPVNDLTPIVMNKSNEIFEESLNQTIQLLFPQGKSINFKNVEMDFFNRIDLEDSQIKWLMDYMERACIESSQALYRGIVPLIEVSSIQNFRVGQALAETLTSHLKGKYIVELEESPLSWGFLYQLMINEDTKCAYECDKIYNKEKIESKIIEYTNQWQSALLKNRVVENWPIKVALDAIKNNFSLLSDQQRQVYDTLINQYTAKENYLQILKAPIYVSIETSQGIRASYGKTVRLSDNIINEIILMTQKSVYDDAQYESIHSGEWQDALIRIDFLINFNKIGEYNLDQVNNETAFKSVEQKGFLLTNDFKRGLVLPNMIKDFSQIEAIKVAMIKGGFDEKDKFDIYTFDSICYV